MHPQYWRRDSGVDERLSSCQKLMLLLLLIWMTQSQGWRQRYTSGDPTTSSFLSFGQRLGSPEAVSAVVVLRPVVPPAVG